jgi:hypothetical protein
LTFLTVEILNRLRNAKKSLTRNLLSNVVLGYSQRLLEWQLATLKHCCTSDRETNQKPVSVPFQAKETENGLFGNESENEEFGLLPANISKSLLGGSCKFNRMISDHGAQEGNLSLIFEGLTFGTSTIEIRGSTSPGDANLPMKRRRLETNATKMLACPFLKHDPKEYHKRRACAWSGWRDVSRVK